LIEYLSGAFPEYLANLLIDVLDHVGTSIINAHPLKRPCKGLFRKKKKQKRKQEVRLPNGTVVDIV